MLRSYEINYKNDVHHHAVLCFYIQTFDSAR